MLLRLYVGVSYDVLFHWVNFLIFSKSYYVCYGSSSKLSGQRFRQIVQTPGMSQHVALARLKLGNADGRMCPAARMPGSETETEHLE